MRVLAQILAFLALSRTVYRILVCFLLILLHNPIWIIIIIVYIILFNLVLSLWFIKKALNGVVIWLADWQVKTHILNLASIFAGLFNNDLVYFFRQLGRQNTLYLLHTPLLFNLGPLLGKLFGGVEVAYLL